MEKRHLPAASASRQRGLTLVEFMISIVLGMILVAAISVLIANQSTARTAIDRGGRMIENGRYAMQVLTDDLLMAGYYGESTTAPTSVTITAMPDPCSTTVVGSAATPGIQEASSIYIQGYDNSNYTSSTLSCVPNWKSGTDLVAVRHADPDTTGITVATLTAGQVYLQTGLVSASATAFNFKFYAGTSGSDATNFTLVNKSGTLQKPRKWHVHIYYIASCSVCTAGSADTIPTLKRVELSAASGAPTMNTVTTIAEGIENLQIDYGVDTDSDGAPDGSDIVASNAGLGTSPTNWQNVVSARLYMLVRSSESVAGYTNSKTFVMGASYPTATPLDPGADAYQRHLFQQAVRLVNPSSRRAS